MPVTITITMDEYSKLRAASNKLGALERAGVDNWEGYSDAMQQWRKQGGEDNGNEDD